MNLKDDLKNLKKQHESLENAKEKLLCEVDSIVKKHCLKLPYRCDFNGDLLLIRFKTRQLDPKLPYEINKELGMEGVLVPRQGYYGIHLLYVGESYD